MSGIVESIGSLGVCQRSDHRVVATLNHTPTFSDFKSALEQQRETGSSRLQIKFLGDLNYPSRHTEGVLRPSLGEYPHGVIFIGRNEKNRHSDISAEWQQVSEFWQRPLEIQPFDRFRTAFAKGFTPTQTIHEADIDRLSEIWKPFGWTSEGVSNFASTYNSSRGIENGWYCGIRNQYGVLCAAAKAEGLTLSDESGKGLNIVESTEWGTHPDSRRLGLGTLAAIGLNVNILQRPPEMPFSVFAEANMAPHLPGHKVARDAGFVSMADFAANLPNGVLPQHVSVDGALRNFLLVQLTEQSIDQHYPKEFLDYVSQITN